MTDADPAGPASAERRAQAPQALRVVRGRASTEEIAALVAVLAAVTTATARPAPPARRRTGTGWAARSGLVRAPLRPGPGAWRASALPR